MVFRAPARLLRSRLLPLLLLCALLLRFRPDCGHAPRAQDHALRALLQQHEEHQRSSRNLSRQISLLKRKLRSSAHRAAVMLPLEAGQRSGSRLEAFLQEQLRRDQVRSAQPVRDEAELVAFESFTLRELYQLDGGVGVGPGVRPDRRAELNGALEAALHLLNAPQLQDSRRRRTFSPTRFSEGLVRTHADTGTLYELLFRESQAGDFRRLMFFRPFAPLMKVLDRIIRTSHILVNIILPLSGGDMHSFSRFISEQTILQDAQTQLTVVLFGSAQLQEVKKILRGVSRNVTLTVLDGTFSRARGLDAGARSWSSGDVLLFFCDVNLRFSADFLNSCRLNTHAGERIFYPVMFSHEEDPQLTAGDCAGAAEQDLVSGVWRDWDFRASCLYRSDYMKAGGFGRGFGGGASADLHLYQRFLRSSLMVVRAPSRDLRACL